MSEDDPRPGRPTKCTPDFIAAIVEQIKAGVDPAVAAGSCGITRQCWNGWLRRAAEGDEPFASMAEQVELARDAWESGLQQALHRTVDKFGQMDPKAIMWTLERRAHERYGRELRVKFREEAARHTIERLRAGLDSETFGRVLECLAADDGEGGVIGDD